jgi:hypothetical protein
MGVTQGETMLTMLIDNARPINDDDWGSDRQLQAECDLWNFVLDNYGIELYNHIEETSVAWKMTTDEYLDFVKKEIESGKWKK